MKAQREGYVHDWRVRSCQASLVALLLPLPLWNQTSHAVAWLSPILFLWLVAIGWPDVRTWPNLVTGARLVVAFGVGMLPDGFLGTEALCALGAGFVLLDFVDGALARHLGQATVIGAALDEEADAFATLVASHKLASRGLAPRALCWHQAAAHYIFVTAQDALCPGFTPSLPFARALAGAMGVCMFGAFAAEAFAASRLAYALGSTAVGLNTLSFGLSYWQLWRAWSRRSAAGAPPSPTARRTSAAAAPLDACASHGVDGVVVFVTVGSIEAISGGYIFERLLVDGLAARRRPPRGDGAARVELWELEHAPPLYPPRDPRAARALGSGGEPLLTEAAAMGRAAALPAASTVVVDGLAVLQLPALPAALAAGGHTLVAFEHYPFAIEVDADAEQRAACRAAEVAFLSACDRVVTASMVSRELLLATFPGLLPPRSIGVVPPPLRFDPALLAHGVSGGRRAPLDGCEPRRLIAVGNLIPRKNVAGVLRCLGEVRRRGVTRWALHVIGCDAARPEHARELRELVATLGLGEHVIWRGELTGPPLVEEFAAAHLFVSGSLFESYGMAAREALAFGVPVIGYATGELERFAPPAAQTLVPVGDEPALTDALEQLITEPPRLRAHLEAAAAAARLASAAEGESVGSMVDRFERELVVASEARRAARSSVR